MRRFPRHPLAAVAAVALFVAVMTQTTLSEAGEDKKVTIGEVHAIHSKILNEKRSVIIHLPHGYGLTTDAYPVLYLLDGKSQFIHSAGLAHFLGVTGAAPQLIVVGIVNTDRVRDFTHTNVAEIDGWKTPSSGGASKFLAFLEQEVFPYVEDKFRTQPYRILVGHSLGGLLATHSLLTRPGLFDAHIAISPALSWDEKDLLKGIDRTLKKASGVKNFLYVTYGGRESKDYDTNVKALRKALKRNAPKGLKWKVARLANDDHATVVHASLYRGLRTLYKGWKPTTELDLAGLRKHFRKLSTRYGYEIRIPEGALNMMGYTQLMKKKDAAKAIEIFELNVSMYPQSANVYDSLGEGYEAAGRLDLALKNYEIAVTKLGQMPKHDKGVMKVYKEHITRVKARMKKGAPHK